MAKPFGSFFAADADRSDLRPRMRRGNTSAMLIGKGPAIWRIWLSADWQIARMTFTGRLSVGAPPQKVGANICF
jgi:hypothetical protein